MFGRILVAMDGLNTGRAGLSFAAQMTDRYKTCVWAFDVPPTVRRHRMMQEIAREAERVGAEVIVLGLERRRISRRLPSGTLSEQLGHMSGLPVMVPPRSADGATVMAPPGPKGWARV
jgi:Asp/Glu/hydantoin racemase